MDEGGEVRAVQTTYRTDREGSDAKSAGSDSDSDADSGLDVPPALTRGGTSTWSSSSLRSGGRFATDPAATTATKSSQHHSDRARKPQSRALCVLVSFAALLVLVFLGSVTSSRDASDVPALAASWSNHIQSRARLDLKEPRGDLSAFASRAFPTIGGRRIGGGGCDMSRCSSEGAFDVSGLSSQPWPYLYIIVPFRNRLASLARLVSSLNSATTPAMRACSCVILSDYKTTVSALPAWQNPACVASYNVRFRMYTQEDDLDEYARRLEV